MPDQSGNPILMTNLLTRAKLLEELQNNPMLFYTYSIQDGDTPEIVADKYYGDPFSYWIVLHSNKILDPIWDWPMAYNQFLSYIDSKYKEQAEAENQTPFEYTNTTVYKYEKITKTVDSETLTENLIYTSITEDDYNSLVPSTETFLLPNGQTCVLTIDKKITTIFDYEYDLNEQKRNIKLLNSSYLQQMQKSFETVMER
jgi:hypothetical protein